MESAKSLLKKNLFKILFLCFSVFSTYFLISYFELLPNNKEIVGSEMEKLYVGGEFSAKFGSWNGSSWSTDNPNFGIIDGIAVDNVRNIVYVAGREGSGYKDGSGWHSFGVPAKCFAVDESTGNVYMSGSSLTSVGGVSVNYIAMWNGSVWTALGDGLGAGANKLLFTSGKLYATGGFTTAGGAGANRAAYWDGSSWHSMGTGLNSTGGAIDVDNDTGNIYFGGWFTDAGGVSVNNIAYWDGSSWNDVGSGRDGGVLAIYIDEANNRVYVGGQFTNKLSYWNGSSWNDYVIGLNSTVYDIVPGTDTNSFYIGGMFSSPYGYVAYWNGSSWSAPITTGGRVFSLAGYYPIDTTVSIGVNSDNISENGGVSTITATLSQASGSDVTVNLAYTGTATNIDDYTRSGTSIVIAAGNTTGTATITGVDDSSYEGNETVIVDVDSVIGASESGTQQVTVTLNDDESAPTVTLSSNVSEIDEDGGVSTVTATLSEASALDTTVNLTYTGTATNTTDYIRSGTSIVITAGNTSGTVTLTGVNDSDIDPDETIIVDIDSVTNGTENGTQSTTVTITDDEAPPNVTLTVDDNSVSENGGVATITAGLTVTSTQDVTVNLAYTGTATNVDDYTRSDTSITITAGANSGTVTVTGVNNDDDEANKTVIVDIDSVTGAVEATEQSVTITIEDDDVIPSVTLSVNNSSVSEDGGVATVTATLAEAGTQDATINLVYTGTAINTSDYTRSSSTISITVGNTSGTVTITGVNDSLDENNETVIVSIDSVTGAVEATEQSVTVTIEDDDVTPSVTLSTNKTEIAENGGVATITATLSEASALTSTINLAYTGTAVSNTDYTPSNNSITIPAGSTTGTVTVTGKTDSIYEGNESFNIAISSVGNCVEATPQSVNLAVVDDEVAPVVSLSTDRSSIVENSGRATLSLTLNNATTQDVTVSLGLAGTATRNSDYTISAQSIIIAAGSTTRTANITAINDLLDESNETVIVSIESVSNATENGTQSSTITITDDDETVAPLVVEEESPVEEEPTIQEEEPMEEEDETSSSTEPEVVTEEDVIIVGGEEKIISEVVYEGEEMEFEEEDVEPVTEEDGIEVGVVLSEDTGDVQTTKKLSGSTLHVAEVKEITISVPVTTLESVNESGVDTVTVEMGDISREAALDTTKKAYVAKIGVDTSGIKGTSTVTAKIVTKYEDGNTLTKGIHFVVENLETDTSIVIELKYVIYFLLLILLILIIWYATKKKQQQNLNI